MKNPDQSISEYVNGVAKELGGTIKVEGFVRFVMGE